MPCGDARHDGFRWRAGRDRLPVSGPLAGTEDIVRQGAAADRSPVRRRHGERGIRQRRFWEHSIRDVQDDAVHSDDMHVNPVRHGLVDHAAGWPYSSFHRCVAAGQSPADRSVRHSAQADRGRDADRPFARAVACVGRMALR